MTYFRTPADVAAELGLKEATVRRLAREYKTFTRVGVKVMFTADDVGALVDKIKNPPPGPEWSDEPEPNPFV